MSVVVGVTVRVTSCVCAHLVFSSVRSEEMSVRFLDTNPVPRSKDTTSKVRGRLETFN